MRTRRTINSSSADLEARSPYAEEHHWGDRQINLLAHDLPALKAAYLIEHLPVSGRVLEVGCGGGRILNTVAARRPLLELHGCDIRPLQYVPAHFGFTLVSPGESTLPYLPGSFDAVVMFDLLEHVVDPVATLHAAGAVLRPGGRLVSFTPLEGQPLSFYRFFRWLLGDDLYLRTKEHLHAYSEESLRRLVTRDFEINDHAYAYHLLGHLMDATLFALMKSTALRNRFWRDNPFYEEEQGTLSAGVRRSPLSRLLRAANVLAYVESRALRRVRHGAAGLLFVATRR